VVFDTGHPTLDGQSNFLAEPLPSLLTEYRMERVPLEALDVPVKRVNLRIKGGVLWSDGILEYSPDRKRAEARQLRIAGVHLTYVHTPQTASAESVRFKTIKATAAKVNNAPDLLLKVDQLTLSDSTVAFLNDNSDHRYNIHLSSFNAHLTNLSNHSEENVSTIKADARFMGSGETTLTGTFRPQKTRIGIRSKPGCGAGGSDIAKRFVTGLWALRRSIGECFDLFAGFSQARNDYWLHQNAVQQCSCLQP
jgi:Domain of Unknown Function (DUF748)